MLEYPKTDKRTKSKMFPKYIVIHTILAGIVGGFFGLLFAKTAMHSNPKIIDQLFTDIWSFTIRYMLIIGFLITIIFTLLIAFYYKKLKKQYKQLDTTSDETFPMDSRIAQTENVILWILHLVSTFSFFFLSISFIKLFSFAKSDHDTSTIVPFLFAMIVFVYNIILIFLVQFQVIELCKKANPERKGNIFSGNFQKEWISSGDEAQQFELYKASYITFMKCKRVLFYLSILLFLCSIIYHPFLSLFIFSILVNFLMNSIYLHACSKLSDERAK